MVFLPSLSQKVFANKMVNFGTFSVAQIFLFSRPILIFKFHFRKIEAHLNNRRDEIFVEEITEDLFAEFIFSILHQS